MMIEDYTLNTCYSKTLKWVLGKGIPDMFCLLRKRHSPLILLHTPLKMIIVQTVNLLIRINILLFIDNLVGMLIAHYNLLEGMSVNKIRRASFVFRCLMLAATVIVISALIIFWSNAPGELGYQSDSNHLALTFIPEGINVPSVISPIQKLTGFLISSLFNTFLIMSFLFLYKLFRLYEQGIFFTHQNVKYIKYTALSLLGWQIFSPMNEALLSLALTWTNAPGERVLQASFGSANISIIVASLIILLVAWVMREACSMYEEQKLTV